MSTPQEPSQAVAQAAERVADAIRIQTAERGKMVDLLRRICLALAVTLALQIITIAVIVALLVS